MSSGFGEKKPEISYPCVWEYCVFVPLDADIKALLAGILKGEYKLNESHKNAKYQSYKINILVASENERLELFRKFKEVCAFVL